MFMRLFRSKQTQHTIFSPRRRKKKRNKTCA
nr:MAG TPA: hypothetical protein [Caudoviricetes sp.]